MGVGNSGEQVEAGTDIGPAAEVELDDLEFVGVDLTQRGLADPVPGDEIGRLAREGVGLLSDVGALGHGEQLPDLVDQR